MTLRCGSCQTEFEPSPGEKPRCPNCLRTLGLQSTTPTATAPPPERRSGRAPGWALALGLLAVAGLAAALILARRGPAATGDAPGASATASSPQEQARRKGVALRQVEEARALLEAGKLREANATAEAVLREAPALPELHQVRGEIYLRSGGLREALGEFVAALSKEETSERHLLAGQTLAALGEPERAERHLRRARTLAPEDEAPVVALGLFLKASGQEEALAALRTELGAQAPDAGPSPLLAALERGLSEAERRAAERKEQLQRALEEAQRRSEEQAGTAAPPQAAPSPAAPGGADSEPPPPPQP